MKFLSLVSSFEYCSNTRVRINLTEIRQKQNEKYAKLNYLYRVHLGSYTFEVETLEQLFFILRSARQMLVCFSTK